MFATGSHDGAVRLWTTAHDNRPSPSELSRRLTARSTHSVTPSLVDNNGARTDNSDAQLGEYTSEPLTLTPVEYSGPRDRFISFARSQS